MADRSELRRLVQDLPRLEVRKQVGYGDGSRKIFSLPRKPVLADGLQVFVEGVEQVIENYSVDLDTGAVTFAAPVSDSDEVTATYHFVSLSDVELDDILNRNPGSIYLAAAEAIRMLLAGRGRLINFHKADAGVDMKAVRKDLMSLAEHYLRLGASATSPKVESFDYPPLADGDGD